MPVRCSRGITTLTALLLMASTSAATADCVSGRGIGVSRIVEIDTTGGPLFGGITKQAREKSFLGPKEVVLTFDDGPMPGVTRPILDTLDTFCTKATFFSVGKMAIAYPEQVRDILRRGHTLGTHTWSHPMSLPRLRGEQALDQIESGFAAVTLAAGQPIAAFFRFPGLNDSPALLGHLESRDIATFTVDVVSNDSYISDPSRLIQRTLREAETENGGILLFHDIKPQTARALPTILAELKARGFRVVHMRAKAPFKTDDHYLKAVRDQIAAKNPSALRSLVAITDAGQALSLAPSPAPAPARADATKTTENQPSIVSTPGSGDAATAQRPSVASGQSPPPVQAATGNSGLSGRPVGGAMTPTVAAATATETSAEAASEPQGLERPFVRRAGRIIPVLPSTTAAGAQSRSGTLGDAGTMPANAATAVTSAAESARTTPLANATPVANATPIANAATLIAPLASAPHPPTPAAATVPPPATAPLASAPLERPNDHRKPRIINAETAPSEPERKAQASGHDAKLAPPMPAGPKPERQIAVTEPKVETPVQASIAAITPPDSSATPPTVVKPRGKGGRRSRNSDQAAALSEPVSKGVTTETSPQTQAGPGPAAPSVPVAQPLAASAKAAASAASQSSPVETQRAAQPTTPANTPQPVAPAANGIEVLAGSYSTAPAASPSTSTAATAPPKLDQAKLDGAKLDGTKPERAKPEPSGQQPGQQNGQQPGLFAAPEIIAGSYRAAIPPPRAAPAAATPRRADKPWNESFADQMRNGN